MPAEIGLPILFAILLKRCGLSEDFRGERPDAYPMEGAGCRIERFSRERSCSGLHCKKTTKTDAGFLACGARNQRQV